MIKYKKDGILINDVFISLNEINENCIIENVKENNLQLLKISWKDTRGFAGIKEEIVLPLDDINKLKNYILGKYINFGEIAGKHSEIYGSVDENDIVVDDDIDNIVDFIKINPITKHVYNYSFILTFLDKCEEGVYHDDISDDDIDIIKKLIIYER